MHKKISQKTVILQVSKFGRFPELDWWFKKIIPPTEVLTSGLLYWCYDVCVLWEPNLQVNSRLLLLDMDLVLFWANHDVIIISHFKWKYVAHNGDLYLTSWNYLKTLPWHQNNINWSTSRVCNTHQSIINILSTVSIPLLRCPHHLGWRWLEA